MHQLLSDYADMEERTAWAIEQGEQAARAQTEVESLVMALKMLDSQRRTLMLAYVISESRRLAAEARLEKLQQESP